MHYYMIKNNNHRYRMIMMGINRQRRAHFLSCLMLYWKNRKKNNRIVRNNKKISNNKRKRNSKLNNRLESSYKKINWDKDRNKDRNRNRNKDKNKDKDRDRNKKKKIKKNK